jgi:dihydroxyacetone kinase-like predicted kinase
LPNNSNIVPVARQVVALSPKGVQVVATAGVQEGFAALLAYDPGSSGEENATRMAQAAAQVVAGEVTQAVRAAPSSVGSVHAGDWIGLSRAGIEAVGSSLSEATCALLEVLIDARHEIVTLIEGQSCPRPEVEAVIEYLAKRHPEVNVERLLGGQPLYPLLVSIE